MKTTTKKKIQTAIELLRAADAILSPIYKSKEYARMSDNDEKKLFFYTAVEENRENANFLRASIE